jgi:CheY-specific phosphatase CheX
MSNASTLDPVIPRSLVDSIRDSFGIQASTPVEIVGVSTEVAPSPMAVDVVSALGMKSSQLQGTLALCLPSKSFLGIINKMLGENFQTITPENADAAGEMLNIIYASARVKWNQAGHDFEPSIPTTARGSNLQMSHGSNAKVVRISCKCEHGDFYLEVSLRRRKT